MSWLGLVEAARTRVGGGDEHEPRGELDASDHAGDDDLPALQRLAERLDRVAAELGEFVQEKDAMVGEVSRMYPEGAAGLAAFVGRVSAGGADQF